MAAALSLRTVLAACLVLAGAAEARVPARVRPGMAYATARRLLLRQGYAPFHLRHRHLTRVTCGGDPAICRAYPEVGSCGGTGRADCEFLFARGRRRVLIVHTVGETPGQLTVEDVRPSDRRAVAGLY